MKSIFVCVLLGIVSNPSTAAAFGGKLALQPVKSSNWAQPRTLRATGDGSQAGNMTVAFVPLISLIANLLPRFFNRYATAPNAQRARSFIPENVESLCQEPVHVGRQWPDRASSSHYYECKLTRRCSTVNQVPCYVKKLKKCQKNMTFDFHKQTCSPPAEFKSR